MWKLGLCGCEIPFLGTFVSNLGIVFLQSLMFTCRLQMHALCTIHINMLFYEINNGLFPYWIYMSIVEKIYPSSALKLNADTMLSVLRLPSFQNFANKFGEISRETLPEPPITRQAPRWPSTMSE